MQDKTRKQNSVLWHSSSVQDVMSELETSLGGLNDHEAAERLQKIWRQHPPSQGKRQPLADFGAK